MATASDMNEFLKFKSVAVVGVSQDRGKFGNIIYRDLKAKRYDVHAVNPRINEVEGDTCYPDLKSLPDKVEGIVIVVPPTVTESVVREAATTGIKSVWIQPGAESEAAIEFCNQNDIAVVFGACVMVESMTLR